MTLLCEGKVNYCEGYKHLIETMICKGEVCREEPLHGTSEREVLRQVSPEDRALNELLGLVPLFYLEIVGLCILFGWVNFLKDELLSLP